MGASADVIIVEIHEKNSVDVLMPRAKVHPLTEIPMHPFSTHTTIYERKLKFFGIIFIGHFFLSLYLVRLNIQCTTDNNIRQRLKVEFCWDAHQHILQNFIVFYCCWKPNCELSFVPFFFLFSFCCLYIFSVLMVHYIFCLPSFYWEKFLT